MQNFGLKVDKWTNRQMNKYANEQPNGQKREFIYPWETMYAVYIKKINIITWFKLVHDNVSFLVWEWLVGNNIWPHFVQEFNVCHQFPSHVTRHDGCHPQVPKIKEFQTMNIEFFYQSVDCGIIQQAIGCSCGSRSWLKNKKDIQGLR